MGVDFAEIRFFDEIAKSGNFEGPMLALGSLDIQESEEAIISFAAQHKLDKLSAEKSVSAYFHDLYGIKEYVCCDINDLADFNMDLGKPLLPEHVGRYGSILNGGTLEHVFNVAQALKNIHDAVKVGGLMIHTLPVTWYNHGLYNLNPILFHLMSEVNDYECVAEGFYFNRGTWPNTLDPIVSLTHKDPTIPGRNETEQEMFSGGSLPANCMHLIALRKTIDAEFVEPVQIGH